VRILVLGGTSFLGRALVDAALTRGHEVTLFNRGRTNPRLYPEVERLIGDRAGDLVPLRGRSWDAVIDTCGYVPNVVSASLEALSSSGLYCFVSSISVYADFSVPVDESSELAEVGDLPDDQVTDESYDALKALCQRAVTEAFGDRSIVVRPGLITGPHDPTGRFTYWPHRVVRGGEVLAPAPPEKQIQSIDVRDLGAWIVSVYEAEVKGVFNATHPGFTWRELLDACRSVARSDAAVTWVSPEFLAEREVGQWMELPLWIRDPKLAYADRVDVSRARAAGLGLRPLEDAVRGALEQAGTTDTAGLAPEREAALLAEWHARG
jgi:nucleoside-diphosphate-sugar epimerase